MRPILGSVGWSSASRLGGILISAAGVMFGARNYNSRALYGAVKNNYVRQIHPGAPSLDSKDTIFSCPCIRCLLDGARTVLYIHTPPSLGLLLLFLDDISCQYYSSLIP
jgi:hypothetical protein